MFHNGNWFKIENEFQRENLYIKYYKDDFMSNDKLYNISNS